MKKLLQTYLQYSKRIAIFGIIQWSVAATLVILISSLAMLFSFHLEESVSSLLKNIVTSSSALAIATSGGYYAHSAYDNALKKKVTDSFEHAETETSSENG